MTGVASFGVDGSDARRGRTDLGQHDKQNSLAHVSSLSTSGADRCRPRGEGAPRARNRGGCHGSACAVAQDAPEHLLVREVGGAGLLLVGSHGHGTLTGALLGSVKGVLPSPCQMPARSRPSI